MMGLDLQPDGLTSGLAGHCQPDKKYPESQKSQKGKRSDLYVCFMTHVSRRNNFTYSALTLSK